MNLTILSDDAHSGATAADAASESLDVGDTEGLKSVRLLAVALVVGRRSGMIPGLVGS
jgi:hypothetical protein